VRVVHARAQRAEQKGQGEPPDHSTAFLSAPDKGAPEGHSKIFRAVQDKRALEGNSTVLHPVHGNGTPEAHSTEFSISEQRAPEGQSTALTRCPTGGALECQSTPFSSVPTRGRTKTVYSTAYSISNEVRARGLTDAVAERINRAREARRPRRKK